jgi:hypothetical protein
VSPDDDNRHRPRSQSNPHRQERRSTIDYDAFRQAALPIDRARGIDVNRTVSNRRVTCSVVGLVFLLIAPGSAIAGEPSPPVAKETPPLEIGARRELFVDDVLIDRLAGDARRVLHHPQPQEIVLVHDEPWEGAGCGYHSVFRDGDLYRMYYKAWHLQVKEGEKVNSTTHPGYCCYAESRDGIQWEKPNLGLFEFRGSKDNNIVMATGEQGGVDVDAAHPAVFKDDNPAAPPESRYKALFRSNGPHGLLAFASSDGVHFSPMADAPVITDGAFDSQNLAFWDATHGVYRAYWRYFTAGVTDGNTWTPAGVRGIRTATSTDFLHWSEPQDLEYVDSPLEQLYTNQIKPYPRAPHLLIGFPMRYVDRGWQESTNELPELDNRKIRAATTPRYGSAVTDCVLMSSRDGVMFDRWNEAFIRPGIERSGTWNYGQNCMAWHAVETKSALDGAPDELSLYGIESYWTGDSSALRRYTLRLDGFASIQATAAGGEVVTRPVTFTGDTLELNFSTSAAGSIRVELQDHAGTPIPGYTLADCHDVFGDSLDRKVAWKDGSAVARLQGRPLRLRFVLKDADLYAFRFAGME